MIRCVSADEASSSLPEDPLLAAMAASLGGAGHFVMVVDDQWRLAYVSEDQRLAIGQWSPELTSRSRPPITTPERAASEERIAGNDERPAAPRVHGRQSALTAHIVHRAGPR